MNILEEIAEYTKKRVAEAQRELPAGRLKALCEEYIGKRNSLQDGGRDGAERSGLCGAPGAFRRALLKPQTGIIAEIKKASPSKGVISEDFPYTDIAADYEEAGADCISCLTEPKWFLGSDEIFREVRGKVSLPMLRKDFTVSEYQIYESALLGADAVLLICSILEKELLCGFMALAHVLGMDVLVETHDAAEIETALCAGADIIGVNNRNLRDFSVDLGNAERLRQLIPRDVVFVAESGVRTPEDVKALREAGADAVLVGEALMRSPDRKALLRRFREAAAL